MSELDELIEKQRELLKPYLEPIAAHILAADEAYFIHRAISEHASGINEHNLGLCLRPIQASLADTFLLSLTKLFERPHRRYQLNSIPVTLDYLLEHCTDFVPLETNIAKQVVAGVGNGPCGSLLAGAKPTLCGLLARFEESLPGTTEFGTIPALDEALEKLRLHRNKRVAHPERVEGPPLASATWEDARKLLDYARCFVGVFGWALTNTAYLLSDGRYLLAEDAERTSLCMGRLFEMAGILRSKVD